MKQIALGFALVALAACGGDPAQPSTSSTNGGGGGGGAPPSFDAYVRFSQGTPWCAVRASGRVTCWQVVAEPENVHPEEALVDATHVTVQFYATCALRASGKVACWGTNTQGELLSLAPLPGDYAITTPLDLPGVEAIALSSELHATCIVNADRMPVCFGMGFGVHPISSITDTTDISGGEVGCALHASGKVTCWEKLGDVLVPTGIEDAKEVSVLLSKACALHADGTISCWVPGTSQPAKVAGFSKAVLVRTGNDEVCAVDELGDVYCRRWDEAEAKPLDLHDAKDLGIDFQKHCVIHTNGEMDCPGVSFH